MKMYWPMRISNKEISRRANISIISEQIFRQRWKFIGHVLRMETSKHPKTILTWLPEGRRSRGSTKELGGGPQKKIEQHWVLAHGTRQQWLLVTV